MRAYRRFDRYDMQQPFWQWIASIANHYCIDLLRQRNRSAKLFSDEAVEIELLESEGKHALTVLTEKQDAAALEGAISELPDKYRVPLVLAYFHESSYDQIAEDLEISRNHVGVLLLRAKKMLRKITAGNRDTGAT